MRRRRNSSIEPQVRHGEGIAQVEIKVGSRLKSVIDSTEVVVIRAPDGWIDLRCGGLPMIDTASGDPPCASEMDPSFAGPTNLGKRYTDKSGSIEVLCTKGGSGALSVGDIVMEVKAAKPLPSSD